MRFRSFLSVFFLWLCSTGMVDAQTSTLLNQISDKMTAAGYDSLTVASKVKTASDYNEEPIKMLIEALDNDTDASMRHARYHDPDFERLARLMIDEFKYQSEAASRAGLPGLSDGDISAIITSDYYKPVIGLIEMMGIDGFNVKNLNKYNLNPYKNKTISQALVDSPKQTPEQTISALVKALSSLYRSYGMVVRSLFNVHNSGETLVASLYGERQYTNEPPSVKLTFEGGELQSASGLRPSLKLESPESKNDDFIYDYLAFPNVWLKEIPDSVLWLSLFDSPRWDENIVDNEIIMVSDKGSQVVGFDKNYYASKVVTSNKVNRLFIDWYVPYQGLNLNRNATDQSSLWLVTPIGRYKIDGNGHIAQADAASQKVLSAIHEALTELRAKINQETEMYGDKSYIEVLDVKMCNTDEKFKNLNTSSFYAEDIRFLAPKLYVRPHTSIPRDITLFYKIYDPKGKLCSMPWSPKGYTIFTNLSLNPDEESIVLSSWGDADKGVFKPGNYRLEVYSEAGVLLFKTTFDILWK